jgi:DNA-binding LacI/PurR family transcriptional regulator
MTASTSLREVAHAAGVSPATVSRVLNARTNVRSETRLRVERAIETLNYQPSRVARRLRTQDRPGQMLGLLVPDIQNPFYVEVVRGVEDRAYARGCAVMMCNFGQEEEKEHFFLDIMRHERVDGLILAPARPDDRKALEVVRSGIPVVCVDRGLAEADVDTIVVDNLEGARAAVDHLLRLGHRRIGHVAGLPQLPSTQERVAGYRAALQAAGLTSDPALVRHGNSKHESGRDLTADLLDLPDPPTALFTGNNLITLGALETIHRRGLRIPEDVALVGFDDMYWAISLNPPLTAVSQPGYEIGRRAAELLFQRVAEPNRPSAKVVLKTSLVVRRSCGAAAIPGRNTPGDTP